MTRIYKTPFATIGDKENLADTTVAGKVSLEEGWTDDYSKDQNADPNAKDVGRLEMNGILHEITQALAELQINVYPEWQDIGGWSLGSIVRDAGKLYRSKKNNNTDATSVSASWSEIPILNADTIKQALGNSKDLPMSQDATTKELNKKLAISQNLSDLDNAATARNNLGLESGSLAEVKQSTGSSTTDVMSQDAVTTAIANADAGIEVVQTTGQSTEDVMSQKATSAEINKKLDKSQNLNDLADTQSARNNLGLGTVAVRDVGKEEGKVVTHKASAYTVNETTWAAGMKYNMQVMEKGSAPIPSDSPASYGSAAKGFALGSIGGWETQILFNSYGSPRMFFRNRVSSGGAFAPWEEVFHTGNNPSWAQVTGKPSIPTFGSWQWTAWGSWYNHPNNTDIASYEEAYASLIEAMDKVPNYGLISRIELDRTRISGSTYRSRFRVSYITVIP